MFSSHLHVCPTDIADPPEPNTSTSSSTSNKISTGTSTRSVLSNDMTTECLYGCSIRMKEICTLTQQGFVISARTWMEKYFKTKP